MKLRMKKLVLSLCLLITLPLWAQEPVGQVADLVGNIWVTHRGAKPTQALFRESIYLGDELQTKADGGVKILFVDDTLLTIKENSKVLITEFLFNPTEKTRKVSFHAAFGRVRAIVGRFFGKDQLVEIKTPTAVAGIRGTDVGALSELKTTTFYCFQCEPNVVATYNVQFPDQIVSPKTGELLAIFAGRAASTTDLAPIPRDILDRQEILFDIQRGAAAGTTRQTSSDSAKATATETKATTAATTPSKTEEGLIEKATAARETEETTTILTPTTTDSTTAEIISGAKDEASTGASIKITLPQ